jgi:hypothetical protein
MTALRIALMAALVCGPAIARADVVHDWNAIMLTTVAAQNPFAQARFAAITQLAVFEAVNACTRRYEPYIGTVIAPWGASAEAAAVAAAHGVLKQYFPAAAATLDASRAASLAAIRDGSAKRSGVVVGEAAATAMIAARIDDGASPPETFLPDSTDAGVWQPTPPLFGPGILLHWRNLTPFGIPGAERFRSAPPPALGSGKYARDYNEVMALGAAGSVERRQDRTDVARYFAVVSAVHAWNSAIQQVSAGRRWPLTANARAFALVNMAISDGLVSSMETKYFFNFWRPVTAIRAAAGDGNADTDPDVNWTPLVGTPSFPGYPSAHASASYAARRIAETLFGNGWHPFTLSHPAVPGVTLQYTTFRSLTHDIDDARVFGGIHFRFDQEAGARQGWRVGRYVFRHHLRPRHHGGGR